ncbi:MAG: hypothetical protein KBF89_08100 [Acidimicrobiia bacterium]|nr:hypothetical protein [Acidimicrobiia bacterium]
MSVLGTQESRSIATPKEQVKKSIELKTNREPWGFAVLGIGVILFGYFIYKMKKTTCVKTDV